VGVILWSMGVPPERKFGVGKKGGAVRDPKNSAVGENGLFAGGSGTRKKKSQDSLELGKKKMSLSLLPKAKSPLGW